MSVLQDKVEILRCPDCGAVALSINDYRVTGPNCKRWHVIYDFWVDVGEIKQQLVDEE